MNFKSKLFYSYLILAATYVSVSLIAAPPRTSLEHYHLSPQTLRLLDSTVVVPVVLIWLVGIYGYQRLHRYALSIHASRDGRQVMKLTRGFLWLAFWLPVTSTVSAVLNYFGHKDPVFGAPASIIVTYLGLILPLVAFVLISNGARGLSNLNKQRPSQAAINMLAGILILIGVFYGYMIASSHDKLQSVYHMPVIMVLLTVVSPYIFAWFSGLLAVYEIHMYGKKAAGILYRNAWNLLAAGIGFTVIVSVALQYLTSSARLGAMSLMWLLISIYSLVALLSIGYGLVAAGAKRLSRIEEV